jgi:hypothetical protein
MKNVRSCEQHEQGTGFNLNLQLLQFSCMLIYPDSVTRAASKALASNVYNVGGFFFFHFYSQGNGAHRGVNNFMSFKVAGSVFFFIFCGFSFSVTSFGSP